MVHITPVYVFQSQKVNGTFLMIFYQQCLCTKLSLSASRFNACRTCIPEDGELAPPLPDRLAPTRSRDRPARPSCLGSQEAGPLSSGCLRCFCVWFSSSDCFEGGFFGFLVGNSSYAIFFFSPFQPPQIDPATRATES